MIKINIAPTEVCVSSTGELYELPGGVFRFEYSLLAISKWESKYCKCYLRQESLTREEELDLLYMMCLDDNFRKEYMSSQVIAILSNYIRQNHSAVSNKKGSQESNKFLPTEKIYAYMAIAGLDLKLCETWEIHRLINTLNYIGDLQNPKENKGKQVSAAEAIRLNEEQKRKRAQMKG